LGWNDQRQAADIAHTWDAATSIGYIHIAYNSSVQFGDPIIRVWKLISLSPLTYDNTFWGGQGFKDCGYPTLPTTISTLGNGLCHKDNSGNYLISTFGRDVILIDLSVPPTTTWSLISQINAGSSITGDIMYTTQNRIILSRTQVIPPNPGSYVSQYIYGNSTFEVEFQYTGIGQIVGLWEESGTIYGVNASGDKYELPVNSPYTPISSPPNLPFSVAGASQIPPCVDTDFIP
jgi:hypothetical protein